MCFAQEIALRREKYDQYIDTIGAFPRLCTYMYHSQIMCHTQKHGNNFIRMNLKDLTGRSQIGRQGVGIFGG